MGTENPDRTWNRFHSEEQKSIAYAAFCVSTGVIDAIAFGSIQHRLALTDEQARVVRYEMEKWANKHITPTILDDPPPPDKWSQDDGTHPWDGALTDALKKTGKNGKEAAKIVAKEAQENGPLAPWLRQTKPTQDEDTQDSETSPWWIAVAAMALWSDVVRPRTRNPSSMVRATLIDRVLPAMTQQLVLPELDDGIVRDQKDNVIGKIALVKGTTLEAVRHGASKLGSVHGHRLIRTLIHRSHEAWRRGDPDSRQVIFDGGWAGLANAIGYTRNNYSVLKDIVRAGECIRWETPHLEGGALWMQEKLRGSKNQSAATIFILGNALTPGLAARLASSGKKSHAARIARRLIPELRFEPPVGTTRPNEHGAIWTLHRMVLVHMVDHAEELHMQGAVTITKPQWAKMARQAHLPTSILDRTLGAWVDGDNDTAPPLLIHVDDDGWTLANQHEPERDFIAEGGERRARGRRGGRKGKEKKGR